MAVLYISEAEAIRDFASLLAKVRAGTEVVIEDEELTVARLCRQCGKPTVRN